MADRPQWAPAEVDLELVGPGVVQTPRWRPEPSDDDPQVAGDYPDYADVGCKP